MIRTIAVFLALAALAMAAEPAMAHHVMDGKMPVTAVQGLLSGLGHPIIGLDHLAAVVAAGFLAAAHRTASWLVLGYVLAMIAGAALHVQGATVPGAEILVALSVLALGGVTMQWRAALGAQAMLALFVIAGAINGYALGESIAGAEPTPLYAYFAGLAIVQSAVGLAAMTFARALAARDTALIPVSVRLVGAGVVGIGLAMLSKGMIPGA
jgi:urease accessory protein